MLKLLFLTAILSAGSSCDPISIKEKQLLTPDPAELRAEALPFDTSVKVVHILVALCDNKYQGIVPVPAGIGNGQDPNNNLYWGCSNGIRSYFKKSKEWRFVRIQKLNSQKLERIIFKHASRNFYLVADAYDGKFIQTCTEDFLNSCSGKIKDTIQIENNTIGIQGNAQLLAYIGHDGLMDFKLSQSFQNADGRMRDCIILACLSKKYFSGYIKQSGAYPLIWTTGLMAPEAYTIHDALTAYINNESRDKVCLKATQAYAKFQKCSLKAAKNLLVSGM